MSIYVKRTSSEHVSDHLEEPGIHPSILYLLPMTCTGTERKTLPFTSCTEIDFALCSFFVSIYRLFI